MEFVIKLQYVFCEAATEVSKVLKSSNIFF
jgi:hypothetical protein